PDAAPSNLSARPIAAMCRSAQSKTAGSGRLWSPLAGSARLGLGLGLGVEVGVEVGSRFWVGGGVSVGDQSDCRPTARLSARVVRLRRALLAGPVGRVARTRRLTF